jgi:hypothetical protein
VDETGQLNKVKIQAFKTPDYTGDPVGEFKAFVNPAEITMSFENEWDAAQGSGTTNSRMTFKKAKPGDLSLTLYLDGTGANGQPLDVQQKIQEFLNITGYNGDMHRPNYLKVAWGTLPVKKCVLKGASIAYKLFTPNGDPIRAVITANFTDNSDDQARVAKAQDKSPDLTHVRRVKAGDTLPLLCFAIYGDPFLYVQVADANGIADFRNLIPGTQIVFPPLEKNHS